MLTVENPNKSKNRQLGLHQTKKVPSKENNWQSEKTWDRVEETSHYSD
jgi:hypothetical protein